MGVGVDDEPMRMSSKGSLHVKHDSKRHNLRMCTFMRRCLDTELSHNDGLSLQKSQSALLLGRIRDVRNISN